ncbi:MAG: DUF819 family protein [bacterium]
MSAETVAPLLTDPLAIFMLLLTLVGAVFYISEFAALKKFFHYFPPLIFCYFLPMIATTLGITPNKSDLYDWFNKVFLPPTLLLLLISADIKAIAKLGPKAVGVMLAGSAGIVVGSVVGYALFRDKLDPLAWQNIGTLAASWTGGSANMFAVKAALDIPNDIFTPMIIVDSVMAYSWMGIIIALAGWQHGYARLFHVDERLEEEMNERIRDFSAKKSRPITTRDLLVTLTVAMVGGYLCLMAGRGAHAWYEPLLDNYKSLASQGKLSGLGLFNYQLLGTLSAFTLTVILVTALGLMLSFTRLSNLEETGASKVGYTMLFLLLPTFGAQANLRQIGEIPWYAAVGAVMIIVHASFIFVTMRMFKAPLFFGAVGSQANVGGPASASIVATTYQPPLAPVGILLGILGGVLGTYLGLVTAYACKFFAP